MDPMPFRPKDPEQRERVLLLSFLFDTTTSDVLRQAVDTLYAQHAGEIAAVLPAYQAAQAALAQARQAADQARG